MLTVAFAYGGTGYLFIWCVGQRRGVGRRRGSLTRPVSLHVLAPSNNRPGSKPRRSTLSWTLSRWPSRSGIWRSWASPLSFGTARCGSSKATSFSSPPSSYDAGGRAARVAGRLATKTAVDAGPTRPGTLQAWSLTKIDEWTTWVLLGLLVIWGTPPQAGASWGVPGDTEDRVRPTGLHHPRRLGCGAHAVRPAQAADRVVPPPERRDPGAALLGYACASMCLGRDPPCRSRTVPWRARAFHHVAGQ